MKKLLLYIILLIAATPATAQNHDTSAGTLPATPVHEILIPVLMIGFLTFLLTSLVRYFLDYRLKNKLIDRGMSEQLSAYLLEYNPRKKQDEVVKMAILCCGIGLGLTIVYLTAPIHIHSLAMMAFSLGLSHLAYFFYLRKSNT